MRNHKIIKQKKKKLREMNNFPFILNLFRFKILFMIIYKYLLTKPKNYAIIYM